MDDKLPPIVIAQETGTTTIKKPWLWPTLLVVAIACAYLPSLSAGFLNYDDDWLIEHNTFLDDASFESVMRIWTDTTKSTRLALGAEYLPVRDTFMWTETQLFGKDATAMRVVSLLFYIAAILVLRKYLIALIDNRAATEVTVWLFALHPVHVESVAWLAGQKDVIALFFCAGALRTYARKPQKTARVVTWTVLACFSKAIAVVLPVLFVLSDLWKNGRELPPRVFSAGESKKGTLPLFSKAHLASLFPHPFTLGASFAVAILATIVHVHIGKIVGMFAPSLGGSVGRAAWSMQPVIWRYLHAGFVPTNLSVVYEVPVRAWADITAWVSFIGLLSLVALVVFVAIKHGERRPALALAFFLLPLLPTSNVLAPIQNAMADRYLIIALLGPCLCITWALFIVKTPQVRDALVAVFIVSFFVLTWHRASLFADSEALFLDATQKTTTRALAPYQLAMARMSAGDETGAEKAYRIAWMRKDAGKAPCQSANNLSSLLAKQGRDQDAIDILRSAVVRCSDNPKTLNNLAELLARTGQEAEARARFEELIARFPEYEKGALNYNKRYGAPPLQRSTNR